MVCKLANTRCRAYSPALQAVCSLMSPGKQMPLSEALADLQTRKRALSRSFACVAGGLLVNLHITHESALRALHPAAQDIRSLMSAEKQMSASAAACCFVSYKLANTRCRAYSPALQVVCSLMSAEKQMSASAAACFSFALIISWLGFNHKETKTL